MPPAPQPTHKQEIVLTEDTTMDALTMASPQHIMPKIVASDEISRRSSSPSLPSSSSQSSTHVTRASIEHTMPILNKFDEGRGSFEPRGVRGGHHLQHIVSVQHSLNPAAQAFKPSSSHDDSTSISSKGFPFELRWGPEKGYGLFATRIISTGERIISEKPLLQISHNDVDAAYHAYLKLSKDDRDAYDQLHCQQPQNIGLAQAAESCVTSSSLPQRSELELKQEMSEHVRVMSIFATNDFILADGQSMGVFKNASRINHSCTPNVHSANNAILQHQTVHATRPILPGEELIANYLGAKGIHTPRLARRDYLKAHYGFVCDCVACNPTTNSDNRRALIAHIYHGLHLYTRGAQPDQSRGVPYSLELALKQAEDGIGLLIQEGLQGIELLMAFRFASAFALRLADYERAVEYALNEEEVEYNILGPEVGDLVCVGGGSKQWIQHVNVAMDMVGWQLNANFWREFPVRVQKAYNPDFAGHSIITEAALPWAKSAKTKFKKNNKMKKNRASETKSDASKDEEVSKGAQVPGDAHVRKDGQACTRSKASKKRDAVKNDDASKHGAVNGDESSQAHSSYNMEAHPKTDELTNTAGDIRGTAASKDRVTRKNDEASEN